MHGIVFTSFRHFVVSRYGSERATELWAAEPPYLITRAYPDAEFGALFARVADSLAADPDELMRAFGRFAGERTFVMLYPTHYDEAGSARAFLLGVEERIHRLVRSTVPDAAPPELGVEPLGEDGVRIAYRSPRRLCSLLEGLVQGTAAHYGERVEVAHARCVHAGDEACVVEARFG